ncbi:MAG: nicotinate-nucleotide adenylyltransferase [Alphaproteobacteria bacterium]
MGTRPALWCSPAVAGDGGPGPRSVLTPGLRVGLLGGSFNPAHDGHRHISLLALRRLRLDVVLWLVSPQNPLKSASGMAPFAARVARARDVVANHPAIRVSDFEPRLGTRYTADTLAVLKRRFPHTAFVWLMGADNFVQLPLWNRWHAIMQAMPVAVIARPGASLAAPLGRAARIYGAARVREDDAQGLPVQTAPAWVFLRGRLHPQSSTAIRGPAPDWHGRSNASGSIS